MKISKEQKITIIKEIEENGVSVADICSRYNLNKETVNQLRSVFKLHGYDGIIKEKQKTYSTEFKLEVVGYVKTFHDSMRNASIKYNLTKTVVRDWVIKYDKYGTDAFSEERRGRKLPKSKPRGRVPKKSQLESSDYDELQQLRKRNKYLEMENEFLKKLDALVQERVKQEHRR